MKLWLVTWKYNGETKQEKVWASCIIESITKVIIDQSMIISSVRMDRD